MNHAIRFTAAFVAATASMFAAPGCTGQHSDDPTAAVLLTLSEVPAEVACARVTASSDLRTTERTLDLVSGMPLVQTLTGMPLGNVTFVGEAFSQTCDAVTASTIPSWVSDPVTAAVVLGRLTSVTLTMHRNGRTKVAVDFPNEPACGAAQTACLISSECCSGVCSRKVCQADADAGVDAGSDGP